MILFYAFCIFAIIAIFSLAMCIFDQTQSGIFSKIALLTFAVDALSLLCFLYYLLSKSI